MKGSERFLQVYPYWQVYPYLQPNNVRNDHNLFWQELAHSLMHKEGHVTLTAPDELAVALRG